jgi:hypothetical protein
MGMIPKVKCGACGGTGKVMNKAGGPGVRPGPAPSGSSAGATGCGGGTPCKACGGKGVKDGPTPGKKPV